MRWIVNLAVIGTLAATGAQAAEDPHAAEREALRKILAEVETAINKHDVPGMLKHLHPDVVVLFQNAEVARGHDQITAYYNRMMKGTSAVLMGYATKAQVDAPASFYGNTAVAYGSSTDRFEFIDTSRFDLKAKWSSTLVKTDQGWKAVSLHFSTNLFDNPILDNTVRFTWLVGIVAGLLGIVLGVVIGRLSKRG